MMKISITKESALGEKRVAGTPKTVKALSELGFAVCVEQSAGVLAGFSDTAYSEAGATVVATHEAWQADIVLKIHPPRIEADAGAGLDSAEYTLLREGSTVISFVYPAQNEALLTMLAKKKVTLLAMDMVPRISRAQNIDALSAMANMAGYRAVIEAANVFGRFLGGQITAAGNIPPCKVLVVGAGVAGLSAIGVAGNLGASVRAFDSRAETSEQVQSMGAAFLSVSVAGQQGSDDGYAKEMSEEFNQAAMTLYAEQAREVDIIITTAMIPNKPAPQLITKAMVDSMKSGSVIVDLAALTGGNCECTVVDKKVVTDNGVIIIGYTDMANRLPMQASQLYGVTLLNLIKLLCPDKNGAINIDFDDPVQRAMTVLKNGELTYPPPPVAVSQTPAPATPPAAEQAVPPAPPPRSKKWWGVMVAALAMVFMPLAAVAPPDFTASFMVFVLACVCGYYVVWNVTHALHTPLMSVTNAISGIIVLGAVLQMGSDSLLVRVLAFFAILIASINIFGGFAVTRRMLNMFRRQDK